MTEKRFWQSLKRLLPVVDWQRIETITASGVPDVNGCHDGSEFWIELKVLKGKRSLSFQSPLKPIQSAWLLRRWRKGGRTFVAACYDGEIWVWPGYLAPQLVRNTHLEKVLCWKFKRPFDKALILSYLT